MECLILKGTYRDNTFFLPEQEHLKKMDEFCVERVTLPGTITPAFHPVREDTIYVNKSYYTRTRNRSLIFLFRDILHELIHISPVRKTYAPPIRALGITEDVIGEHGFTALVPYERNGCSSIAGQRHEIDEIVVHDVTTRMAEELGLSTQDGPYDRKVAIYRSAILTNLFGGDFRELLRYHQATESNAFFQAIGQRLLPEAASAQQLYAGTEYVVRLMKTN